MPKCSMQDILTRLARHPEGMTSRELADSFGATTGDIGSRLNKAYGLVRKEVFHDRTATGEHRRFNRWFVAEVSGGGRMNLRRAASLNHDK